VFGDIDGMDEIGKVQKKIITMEVFDLLKLKQNYNVYRSYVF